MAQLKWYDFRDDEVVWDYDFVVKYPNVGKKGRWRVVRHVKGQYQENVLDVDGERPEFIGEPVLKTDEEYKEYYDERHK